MPKFKLRYILSAFILLGSIPSVTQAQMGGVGGSTSQNADLTIGDITITGTKYLDAELLKSVSGLSPGDKIKPENDPGVAKAIKSLWSQQLFSDVGIYITKIEDGKASVEIRIKERPRLATFKITGITKGQESELKDKLTIVPGRMVTEAMKKDIEQRIKKFFGEKGFANTTVNIYEAADSSGGTGVNLVINVDKGGKVHINQIIFSGNDNADDTKLKGEMKGTKEMARISLHSAEAASVYGSEKRSFKNYLDQQGYLSLSKTLDALNPYFRWNIFAGSKFNPKKYEEDKNSVIAYYNSKGYRDAQIDEDTTYFAPNGSMNVEMKVKEGRRYYFGDIKWRGNTKYTDSILTLLLDIKKGDVFNQELFDRRLGTGGGGPEGSQDIGSLYMDDGYLFFKIEPHEKSIDGDTINYEVSIQEGPQATIKNIGIIGNDRTNDFVLRRELFTRPGYKFSRTDIIRSIRQLSNLGFIDPEKVVPTPKPNYADGTVDIDYNIVEKSSDQLELSAGFGGGIGFTGTVGIVFNNFSLRNIFNFKEWTPLPMGDGQKLSLRYQSNGKYFNSANLSFTEPWLGGKKPVALTVSAVYGRQAYSGDGTIQGDPNQHYLRNWGGGVTLSRRLNWPDNNFIFSYGVNYQNYYLHSYDYLGANGFFNTGTSNNLYFKLTLARNTVDQPIYPRSGSNISFSFQFTPPFSAFSNTDYATASVNDKYRWIEYHKYRFTAEFYQRIAGNLVFKFAAKYGYLGYYNKDIGYSPFERFNVGGDGLSGFSYYVGRDIISQRGYEAGYGIQNSPALDATIFNKYTAEVRYPFSLNPSATIFGLAFAEGANGWQDFKTYNPFQLYRSVGVGVRVYLPMFGLLGLDYGIAIDNLKIPGAQKTKFTFMLGFEPE
jgi:outer membrane protein insertion porin family